MAVKPTVLFEPKTGAQGLTFVEKWCDRCAQKNIGPGEEGFCLIMTRAYAGMPTPEWTVGDDGPFCTEYKTVASRR